MLGTNVTAIERPIRIALGIGIAAYAGLALAAPNLVLVAMGACVALTGVIGFCPACALVGRKLRRNG